MGQQDDPRIEFYGQDVPTPEMRRRDHAAEVRELVEALEQYMSQFGQALDAHGIAFGTSQIQADQQARAAIAKVRQQP